MKDLSAAIPLPAGGFHDQVRTQIAQEKQAEFEQDNPELALWLKIKTALADERYFVSELQGSAVTQLRGVVEPECRPTRVSGPRAALLRLWPPQRLFAIDPLSAGDPEAPDRPSAPAAPSRPRRSHPTFKTENRAAQNINRFIFSPLANRDNRRSPRHPSNLLRMRLQDS